MSTSVSACVGLLRRSPSKFTARRVGFGWGYPHRRGRIASIGARLRRSNAQGREWVSRLERRAETCMPGNCRLALMVEVRWVASGFISRTDAPDPACCTIAGGRSTWKCFGSRVGYLPEGAGTRMLRNREPALSVETYWVASGIIRRTGALVHACRAIAVLFVEMLWVASGFIGRTCTPQRAGTIAEPRSPLKYTGLRVSATVVIPARSGLADQPRGTLTVENHSASSGPRRRISTCMRIRRCDDGCTQARPAILAGQGSPADRVLTLTVEMHSVASRFGDRISTRGLRWPRSHARVRTGHARHVGRNRRPNDRVLPRRLTIAYSRSPLHCAALRVACERREAQRNLHVADHAPALAVKMHGLSGDSRNRIFTSRHARGSATHARVRLECATPRTMQRSENRARKGASPDRTPPLTVEFHSISRRFAGELSTTRFMHSVSSGDLT